MPTNLNSLIRYKRIDSCLKNPYTQCTIKMMQEICTKAMGEFRGVYKLVSERTIRDDIRVMRSNILGFNAPIEYNKSTGSYYYSDSSYSIFKTPLTEIDLLKDILQLLLNERNNIADEGIDKLLNRISMIVGFKDKIVTDVSKLEGPLMIVGLDLSHFEKKKAAKTDELVGNDSVKDIPNEMQPKPSPKIYQKPDSQNNRSATKLLWQAVFEVV